MTTAMFSVAMLGRSLSRTQVVALLREGDRVTGVQVRDSENGAVTDVRGHVVVNATGVWTDEIQALSNAYRLAYTMLPEDEFVWDARDVYDINNIFNV